MFEELLLTLKTDMMPLCSQMSILCKALAGLGCFISLGMITIKAMADNEPLNIWAFLRPFSLGFCILFFDTLIIGSLDGIMQPIARATAGIAESQEVDYYAKSDKLEEESSRLPPDPQVVYYLTKNGEKVGAYTEESNPEEIGQKDYNEIARKELAADVEYKKTWFFEIFESLLQILSYAAKMIINIVGSFFLIILAILGPLAFAAACYPPFQNSFSNWLSHYVTTSLWLPIANLFTAVLSKANNMLCDQQLESISMSGSVNSVLMLAMMVVGIFGYFSVPSIANWIVQAGGSGSYTRNMTNAGKKGVDKVLNKASGLKNSLGNLGSRYGGGFKSVADVINKTK